MRAKWRKKRVRRLKRKRRKMRARSYVTPPPRHDASIADSLVGSKHATHSTSTSYHQQKWAAKTTSAPRPRAPRAKARRCTTTIGCTRSGKTTSSFKGRSTSIGHQLHARLTLVDGICRGKLVACQVGLSCETWECLRRKSRSMLPRQGRRYGLSKFAESIQCSSAST
jgi:hypothetical protein